MTVIIQSETAAELKTGLAELDIFVPERSKGRSTCQVERHCIAHLLASLPQSSISFPLAVIHGDRPDFVLQMQGMNVGIEHTEAVPTNTAHEQALRSEGVGSATHLIRRALPNEPRKTKEEITQEILADELGDFWEGDSPEREWAEAIAQCVTVKIQKATASGYTHYKENWLMVYDNWPLPHVDLEKAACFLQTKLDGMVAFANFDKVFVSNEAQICEFRNSGFAIRALVRP